METVDEGKAKVYELHNVVFTFRTGKPSPFAPVKAGFGGIDLVFGYSSDDEDGFHPALFWKEISAPTPAMARAGWRSSNLTTRWSGLSGPGTSQRLSTAEIWLVTCSWAMDSYSVRSRDRLARQGRLAMSWASWG